jgi:hypothetical protein
MAVRYGNGGGHGRRLSVEDDAPLTDRPIAKSFVAEARHAFRPLNRVAGGVKTGKLVQTRVAETVTNAPKVAAAVAGTSLLGAHKLGVMEKREREFDSDARRQVRRGVAAGSLGTMGAGAVGYGAKSIHASNQLLRKPTGDRKATARLKARVKGIGVAARPRDAALVGGGALALTAATRMQIHAGNNRKRGWS